MKRRRTGRHFRPKGGVDHTTGLPKRVAVFRCVCGKSAFTSREAARAALKRTFPSEASAMQVYLCPRRPDGLEIWHFGHPYGYEREQTA